MTFFYWNSTYIKSCFESKNIDPKTLLLKSSGRFKSQQCQQLLTGLPKNIVRRALNKLIKSGPYWNRIKLGKQIDRRYPSGISSGGRGWESFFVCLFVVLFCFVLFVTFWKPLKFVLGLQKWKNYATEVPHSKLLTWPFSLDPPLLKSCVAHTKEQVRCTVKVRQA